MSNDYLLRKFIARVVRTSAQLDRLLSDHFHDVYIQLHGGMTRDERLTLLFSHHHDVTSAVLAGLQQSFPGSYAEAAAAAEFSSLFLTSSAGAAPGLASVSAVNSRLPSLHAAVPVTASPPPAVSPAPDPLPTLAPVMARHNVSPVVIPQHLKVSRARGRLVPFVGAGLSMAVRHKTNVDAEGRHLPLFPSWYQLLLRAAERLRADGKVAAAAAISGLLGMSPARLLDAARYAQESLGPLFYSFLSEQFDPDFSTVLAESLALPRLLWKLGSRLLITTNYDRVLRWACPDELRHNLTVIPIQARVEQLALLREDTARPTVWHLHGSVDDLENIVLTPNGYDLLYPHPGTSEVRYQAALQTLRMMLATRTFLFIGFSLADERFGDQLRWITDTFSGASGPHYLLTRSRDVESTRERLRSLPGIEVVPFDDFGEPLLRVLEALV